jgi:hypothetical protein
MRDKREAITVGRHQACERVLAHDGRSVLGVVELLGQVHGDVLYQTEGFNYPLISLL